MFKFAKWDSNSAVVSVTVHVRCLVDAPADAAEGLLLLGVAADQDVTFDVAARLAPRQHILSRHVTTTLAYIFIFEFLCIVLDLSDEVDRVLQEGVDWPTLSAAMIASAHWYAEGLVAQWRRNRLGSRVAMLAS